MIVRSWLRLVGVVVLMIALVYVSSGTYVSSENPVPHPASGAAVAQRRIYRAANNLVRITLA
jgi:hypothetical protein